MQNPLIVKGDKVEFIHVLSFCLQRLFMFQFTVNSISFAFAHEILIRLFSRSNNYQLPFSFNLDVVIIGNFQHIYLAKLTCSYH